MLTFNFFFKEVKIRFIQILISFVITFICCLFFSKEIIYFIARPILFFNEKENILNLLTNFLLTTSPTTNRVVGIRGIEFRSIALRSICDFWGLRFAQSNVPELRFLELRFAQFPKVFSCFNTTENNADFSSILDGGNLRGFRCSGQMIWGIEQSSIADQSASLDLYSYSSLTDHFICTTASEALSTTIYTCFVCSLSLTICIVSYHLLTFFAPSMYNHEYKLLFQYYVILNFVLVLLLSVLGYQLVIPVFYKSLLSYSLTTDSLTIFYEGRFSDYIYTITSCWFFCLIGIQVLCFYLFYINTDVIRLRAERAIPH